MALTPELANLRAVPLLLLLLLLLHLALLRRSTS